MRFFGFNAYYGNTATKSFNTMNDGQPFTLSNNTLLKLKGGSATQPNASEFSFLTKRKIDVDFSAVSDRIIPVLDQQGFSTVTVEKCFFAVQEYIITFHIQLLCAVDTAQPTVPADTAIAWLGFSDNAGPGAAYIDYITGTAFRVTSLGNTNPIWAGNTRPPYLIYIDVESDTYGINNLTSIKFTTRYAPNTPTTQIGTQRYVLSGLGFGKVSATQ